MRARIALAEVTAAPLDPVAHEAAVRDDRAGAVVSFVGVVRDHDAGRAVDRLDYEAHPSAGERLARIAAEVGSRHEVVALAVSHRTGSLRIGDAALVAVCAAAHRVEAFAACADLVDTVKEGLPVWKLQHLADGTSEWSGCA